MPGRGPQRRSSDPRIDDLLRMFGAFNDTLGRLADDLRAMREENAARREREAEILRRVNASESHHEKQDGRIDKLEDADITLRAEMRGAISAFKWLVSITSIIGAVASFLVALHAIGVIP